MTTSTTHTRPPARRDRPDLGPSPPPPPGGALDLVRAIVRARPTREIVLVMAAYFGYFLVRGYTEGSYTRAAGNAHRLVAFEKAVGFFWEPTLQELIVDHLWMITIANWVYIWAHWPVIAVVAIWLLVKRPEGFWLFRNAFFISGGIGIAVFALFPVAPPRLIDVGVIDTVTKYSQAYRVLQPPAFTNQYAAMPSLHFGWDLLIGIALITQARCLLARIFGAVLPVFMLAASILTANHFIIDVLAGAVVALTGLAVAHRLRGGRWHWWRNDHAPPPQSQPV